MQSLEEIQSELDRLMAEMKGKWKLHPIFRVAAPRVKKGRGQRRNRRPKSWHYSMTGSLIWYVSDGVS